MANRDIWSVAFFPFFPFFFFWDFSIFVLLKFCAKQVHSVQEHILACINWKVLSIPVSESGKIWAPLWTEPSVNRTPGLSTELSHHSGWKVKLLPELPRRGLRKGSSAELCCCDRSLCIYSVHEHLSRSEMQWNLRDYALGRLHKDSAGPTDLWVKAPKLLWWLNSSQGHERHRAWEGWWLFLWFEDCSRKCLA